MLTIAIICDILKHNLILHFVERDGIVCFGTQKMLANLNFEYFDLLNDSIFDCGIKLKCNILIKENQYVPEFRLTNLSDIKDVQYEYQEEELEDMSIKEALEEAKERTREIFNLSQTDEKGNPINYKSDENNINTEELNPNTNIKKDFFSTLRNEPGFNGGYSTRETTRHPENKTWVYVLNETYNNNMEILGYLELIMNITSQGNFVSASWYVPTLDVLNKYEIDRFIHLIFNCRGVLCFYTTYEQLRERVNFFIQDKKFTANFM